MKLKHLFVSIILTLAMSGVYASETIQINKGDYLMLVIGNYVHQFNTFDTSVHLFADTIKINIYYDRSTQTEEMAENFRNRVSLQVEHIFLKYDWANDFSYAIDINSEDMSTQYKQ